MAVLLWWLHGYHAGKSGNIPFETTDPYPSRQAFIAAVIAPKTYSIPPSAYSTNSTAASESGPRGYSLSKPLSRICDETGGWSKLNA
jgi:hypothetical protein